MPVRHWYWSPWKHSWAVPPVWFSIVALRSILIATRYSYGYSSTGGADVSNCVFEGSADVWYRDQELLDSPNQHQSRSLFRLCRWQMVHWCPLRFFIRT